MAAIGAIAPWFGGKRNLAPRIVAELGEHTAFWDVFAGSLAVLLAKPAVPMETVNDLHGDLINLALVIQSPTLGPQFYRQVRRVIMHEDIFTALDRTMRAVESTPPATPDLERAVMYFVVSWMGRNGTAGTPASHKGTFCARFTQNGGHAGTRWRSAVNSIPQWRRRLAHVTILRRDAFKLLERIEDAPGVAIYCDPPYIEKRASYLHDFNPPSHERLATLLHRFRRTRVVVSYYEHSLLDTLYPDWTRVRIDVSKAMAHQGGRGPNDVRATELLLLNGPSYTAEPELFG